MEGEGYIREGLREGLLHDNCAVNNAWPRPRVGDRERWKIVHLDSRGVNERHAEQGGLTFQLTRRTHAQRSNPLITTRSSTTSNIQTPSPDFDSTSSLYTATFPIEPYLERTRSQSPTCQLPHLTPYQHT
jgi:hypothetical protein